MFIVETQLHKHQQIIEKNAINFWSIYDVCKTH